MFIHTYKLVPVEAFWEAVLPICTSTSECQEITDPAYYLAKGSFSQISRAERCTGSSGPLTPLPLTSSAQKLTSAGGRVMHGRY